MNNIDRKSQLGILVQGKTMRSRTGSIPGKAVLQEANTLFEYTPVSGTHQKDVSQLFVIPQSMVLST